MAREFNLRSEGRGVRVVRVRRGGKMMDDLIQMTESRIWRARKVGLLEKVLVAEIPGLQDNPGGETLTSLKAVGKGSV